MNLSSPRQRVGREQEQAILQQLLKSDKAEFLALYGRRRVGKTFLIKTFFETANSVFFYNSGLKDGTLKDQLEEFAKHIGEAFYGGVSLMPRTNWRAAFADLTKAIEQIPKRQKVVIFLDELPWMATKRSRLLQALDYYWNRYWSHDPRIKLIVCGSSASWILEKIINNKGGLYNRVTRTMHLTPFNLHETQAFLKRRGHHLNQKQITELYLALGGIPHYLSLAKKGYSAQQCLDELCFQKGGALVEEFERLFASLFNDAEYYITLIRVIAKHHYGISQVQLIQESGAPSGGRTVQRLKDLEEAGFISSFVPYGHQERGIYYKVVDEFSLFYLRWIEPNLMTIKKQTHADGFWLAKTKTPAWRSWSGYAFESLCYKHLPQIRTKLKIDPGAAIGSWRHQAKAADDQGTQIDLLFDRDDGAITICEIKYAEQPFVLDKAYAKTLLDKVKIFQTKTQSKKQIFIALIAANGVKPSMYSEDLIDGIVILDDLFT